MGSGIKDILKKTPWLILLFAFNMYVLVYGIRNIGLNVQIEKLKDQIVVFNMGESNNHIGKINNIEDQIIEIQTGRTQPFFLNLQYVKTLHQV